MTEKDKCIVLYWHLSNIGEKAQHVEGASEQRSSATVCSLAHRCRYVGLNSL